MKIVEKKRIAIDLNDIEIGDVLIDSDGAKYIVVGEQFSVRCLRLDNKKGKNPFSLTGVYTNIPYMVEDLFGFQKHKLSLVKDAEIHI